ncbi:MAG: histidine kinase [Bacteroidales bacterium]
MNKHLVFLLLGLMQWFGLFSQINYIFDQERADSLFRILPDAKGENRVDVLNDLSYLYILRMPGLSDSLAKLALKLSQDMNYSKGEAYSHFVSGIMNYTMNRNLSAFDELFLAAELSEKNEDTALLIDIYFQLGGMSYFLRGESNIQRGISYMAKAMEYAVSSGNNLRIAQIYATYGYAANTSGDGERGKEMFENYFQHIKGIPLTRMEKALMIASYGDSYKLTGDLRTAINKYLESLSVYDPEAIEERALMSQNASTLGNMYLGFNKPDSALFYYNYGLELAHKYSHLYGLVRNFINLANYFYNAGGFEKSIIYCDSVIFYGNMIAQRGSYYGKGKYDKMVSVSLEIYSPLSPAYKKYYAWTTMFEAYELLQAIYEKQQDISAAYSTFKSSSTIKDSITNFEKNKELSEILIKYETEQKEKQILVLSQENQLQELKIRQNTFFLLGLGGMIILVVLFAVMLLRQNKIKADQQAILLKQQLFRSQMNPHFIFNSLGSIQSSIINEEPDKAVKYLSKFSKLMRNILDSSQEETISLKDELTTIENYLELQKVRFPRKFDYSVEVDEDIDEEQLFLPPMLAQPFIENAIEHGIKHKGSKGNIHVRFKLNELNLIYEVEDDGIGRDKAQEIQLNQNSDHKSLATTITQERIKVLNKKLKHKIKLEIFDLKNEKGEATGTKVIFEVPV